MPFPLDSVDRPRLSSTEGQANTDRKRSSRIGDWKHFPSLVLSSESNPSREFAFFGFLSSGTAGREHAASLALVFHRFASRRGSLLLCVGAAMLWLTAGLGTRGFSQAIAQPVAQAIDREDDAPHELVDLLIVGGTESGWAAAIQAARSGVKSIKIVHDGRWLGGQYTEQALACVDENKGVGKVGWGVDWHPMKRSFHRSGLFLELMDEIEGWNLRTYGSRMPGRPFHGPSTYRPAEAEAIFRKLLQPYVDRGQVSVTHELCPIGATVDRTGATPRVTGFAFAPVADVVRAHANIKQIHATLHVHARLTIDASDWGDAIQACGADYFCGPDPRERFDEPSAPVDLSKNPLNEMNPITWAMIVEESLPTKTLPADAEKPRLETPIPRPENYDDRNYPRVSHLSHARLKSLEWDRPARLGAISHWPDAGKAEPRQLSVYTVRRVVAGETSKQQQTVILLNYMNGQDYPLERLPQRVVDQLEATEAGASLKNIVQMTRAQRQIVFHDAKQHALGVLYHLQSFVHELAPDKTNSFRHFRLSREFGTADHLPPKPYIRESLRLHAMYMMREQDGRNRDGETKEHATERLAHVLYPDGLFPWQFHYDFHRTGRAYLKQTQLSKESEESKELAGGTAAVAEGPWIDFHKPRRHTKFLSDRSVFPMRSLIPLRMDGLLGAQKNVGYSSIVSAAIRLHDQCIAIGQAAGAIAAVSIRHEQAPRSLVYDSQRLEEIRDALCGGEGDGPPLLLWPYRDLAPDHPQFVAINRMAASGALPRLPGEVDFRPAAKAAATWKEQARKLSQEAWELEPSRQKQLAADIAAVETRGETCEAAWAILSTCRRRPWLRKSLLDADGDSIADLEDALLFTSNSPIEFKVAEPPKPEPHADGMPGKVTGHRVVRQFNFGGEAAHVNGYVLDTGAAMDRDRGHGWGRDIRAQNRRRGKAPTLADTFLFTRTHDVWECRLPSGDYLVQLSIGDADHEQLGQNVTIEGKAVAKDVDTPKGHFRELAAKVQVNDGKLTVELGRPGGTTNTCLNWLQILVSNRE